MTASSSRKKLIDELRELLQHTDLRNLEPALEPVVLARNLGGLTSDEGLCAIRYAARLNRTVCKLWREHPESTPPEAARSNQELTELWPLIEKVWPVAPFMTRVDDIAHYHGEDLPRNEREGWTLEAKMELEEQIWHEAAFFCLLFSHADAHYGMLYKHGLRFLRGRFPWLQESDAIDVVYDTIDTLQKRGKKAFWVREARARPESAISYYFRSLERKAVDRPRVADFAIGNSDAERLGADQVSGPRVTPRTWRRYAQQGMARDAGLDEFLKIQVQKAKNQRHHRDGGRTVAEFAAAVDRPATTVNKALKDEMRESGDAPEKDGRYYVLSRDWQNRLKARLARIPQRTRLLRSPERLAWRAPRPHPPQVAAPLCRALTVIEQQPLVAAAGGHTCCST